MVRYWLTFGSLMTMGGLIVANSGGAQADIKYTSETQMGAVQAANAPGKPMMASTTFIMKGAQRTESSTSFGPVHMNTVELKLCDKQQNIKLDPALKIYTVTPFEQKAAATQAADNQAATAATNDASKGTGKIISTTSVKDLGEETVADVKTEHYLMTEHLQMSGCVGNQDMNMKMEMWIGPSLTTELNCDAAQPDPALMMSRSRPTCKMTFEQHGDTGAYAKVMSGIIMRMKTYMGDSDKPTMTQEVTSLSRAKLDESLFAVPADYKQVTEKEFQDAQTKAMMAAMMQQVKAGAGANNGGNNGGGDQGAANNGGNDNGNNGNNGNTGDKAQGNQGDQGNNGNANNGQQEEKPKKKKKKFPFSIPGL